MAKVTLIIEDVQSDSETRVRVSVESDNRQSNEYTPAETLAEQVYAVILAGAESITNITMGKKPEDTTLN